MFAIGQLAGLRWDMGFRECSRTYDRPVYFWNLNLFSCFPIYPLSLSLSLDRGHSLALALVWVPRSSMRCLATAPRGALRPADQLGSALQMTHLDGAPLPSSAPRAALVPPWCRHAVYGSRLRPGSGSTVSSMQRELRTQLINIITCPTAQPAGRPGRRAQPIACLFPVFPLSENWPPEILTILTLALPCPALPAPL